MKRIVLLAVCFLASVSSAFAIETDTLAVNHPEYLPTLQIGTVAPEIVAKDTLGTEIRLSQFRGRYVVLDFWATWCGDCRRETPALKELFAKDEYKTIAEKPVQWIGFSFDDKEQLLRDYLQKNQLPWPQITNLQRTRQDPTFKAYELHWIPAFFVIDPEGKIVGKAITALGLEDELVRIQAQQHEQ